MPITAHPLTATDGRLDPPTARRLRREATAAYFREHQLDIEQDRTMRPTRTDSLAEQPQPPEPSPRPPGRSVARCADGNGTMTGLFFSDHFVDIARAKAMCARCPLAAECLAGALERAEPWGVWGGELLSGGRIVRDKRPCGRPPSRPRPEVVYDEMGPVGADLVTVA